MVTGLNAFFGAVPQPEHLEALEARGVRAVRTDVGDHPAAMVAAFSGSLITPLYLIHITGDTHSARVQSVLRQTPALPPDALCELGNEWNLGNVGTVKMTPAEYAAVANDTQEWFTSLRLRVYYGALSSCNPDAQGLLSSVLHLSPWITRVSIHRYPYRPDQQPSRTPYPSRTAEMQALADVLRQDGVRRRLRITEAGIRCGHRVYQDPWWYLWWRRWHGISEAQQYLYLRQERAYWVTGPCTGLLDGFDVYQENSANSESDYGLNDVTGQPRAAWEMFG